MRKNQPDVYVIHCDYEQGRPETYRGMYVVYKATRLNFNISGKPIIDYQCAVEWVEIDMKGVLMMSSDVDKFKFEVARDGCFFI